MADPDLGLLEQWRGGDLAAGQALFARHFPGILRFFEHKCQAAADELVQQTFLACVKSRDRFEGRSTFRTYLFTVARHELYRHLRGLRRDDERLDFGITSIGELVTTPGTRLGREQDVERLRAALRTLPAEQQLLLEMCYWHELEPAQLAEIFECPPATIRTRLFRARAALRDRMGAMPATSADPLVAGIASLQGEVEP